MKIYTVTDDFYSSVKELFSRVGTTEVLPKNYSDVLDSADLIVFSGGEDINPKRYNEEERGYFNDSRDDIEFNVFREVIKRKKTKILGICRGMQLVNVALGGSLIWDIFEYCKESHPGVHPLKHVSENSFSFLTVVNSMHHQALLSLGQMSNLFYKVHAVEPITGVSEIVTWGNRILGVQFHPEFFSDSTPEKWKFADTVRKWVNDEIILWEKNSKERRYTINSDANNTAHLEVENIVNNHDSVGVYWTPSFTQNTSISNDSVFPSLEISSAHLGEEIEDDTF